MGALLYSASHAHEAPIFHCAGLKQYIGSYHHIVSDQSGIFSFPGNHAYKILKQSVLANSDGAEIATEVRVVPDRAILTNAHVAEDGGVWSDKICL